MTREALCAERALEHLNEEFTRHTARHTDPRVLVRLAGLYGLRAERP